MTEKLWHPMINRILEHRVFENRPPVLMDIGASGEIHEDWKPIAPHSICIAFDADNREMEYIEKVASGFKKLIVYNRVVTETDVSSLTFHLTRSPFCSSLLNPDLAALKRYSHGNLFEVTRSVSLPAITIDTVLSELHINTIDWFKADAQGTDLRLFRSLGDERIRRVLLADFEPGIIDAYEGEDKLYDVMSFMHARSFWMSDLSVLGAERVDLQTAASRLSHEEMKHLTYGYSVLKSSPGWAILSYFNAFSGRNLSLRDYLLGYAFALVKEQLGFALELATKGKSLFDDPMFPMMEDYVLAKIRERIKKRIEAQEPQHYSLRSRVLRKLSSLLMAASRE